MALDTARRLWRRTIPPDARRWIRRKVTDLPHRLRDVVPDCVEGLSSGSPLPPAGLRARVGNTSSRREFLEVGASCAGDMLAALSEIGCDLDAFPRWLDFGCGSGRVARHLAARTHIRRVAGVDVDREAVDWCRRNLPGEYAVVPAIPPMPRPPDSVDVVCAISVFTHMDEEVQRSWLEEIHRVLRRGGLLVATTHSPELTWTRRDLTEAQHHELAERGFLFAPAFGFGFGFGFGSFHDDSTFQSEGYVANRWAGLFRLRSFKPLGLNGYQDLWIWEKAASLSAASAPSSASPPAAAG